MLKNFKKLDKIDNKILKELLKNCRQGNSKIAKKTKISKASVNYRVKRLEEKGIIRGYKTLVNHFCLGLRTHELLILLRKINKKINKKFREFLNKEKVLGYGDLLGHYDFNIVVCTKDSYELEDLIRKIKDICKENLAEIVIMRFNEDKYVFDDQLKKYKNIQLKDYEKEMLNILINDARVPLKELSKRLNKSYPAISKSLKKLEKASVIKNYYPDIDFSKLGYQEYSIYIKTMNESKEERQRFREKMAFHPNIFWYVRYLGNFDWAFMLIAQDESEMREIGEEILGEFGNFIFETKTMKYLENKK